MISSPYKNLQMGFTFNYLPASLTQEEIASLIKNFDTSGKLLSKGRNTIKLFTLNGNEINIKSFKVPIFINRIAYKYFRKSKARRSFEFAQILLKKNIGTPEPLAFYEESSFTGLTKSFYVSRHLEVDLTFRELIHIPDYPDHENILRQFAHFCFELHEKGIEFLDHSPGNTLIKKTEAGLYKFYLVDLNRMRFRKSMDFELRMKNLQRLTSKRELIEVMSNEYAKWYDKPEEIVFKTLWEKTSTFHEKFERKRRIKKKLKAWKQNLFH
jgi:hypothetical protein